MGHNKILIFHNKTCLAPRRIPPRRAHKLLKIHGFMCLGILLCCTACCTWRACLRGIAISARSSRTIKIIQWSGRRSPFDEHGSLPVRGRQVLDVRVTEKADSTARSMVPVLVQGARLVHISKQTPNALNSSLTRKGASIEIMSMARGLTTGQVAHGQEPRRVHTARVVSSFTARTLRRTRTVRATD